MQLASVRSGSQSNVLAAVPTELTGVGFYILQGWSFKENMNCL